MAWRCGSMSRSLLSTAKASTIRSASSLTRHHPPPLHAHSLHPRRLLFTNPRTMGELGCIESLMPLYSMVAASTSLTSHIAVDVRAFRELSQGNGMLAVQLLDGGGGSVVEACGQVVVWVVQNSGFAAAPNSGSMPVLRLFQYVNPIMDIGMGEKVLEVAVGLDKHAGC